MTKLDDKINKALDAFVVVGWMANAILIALLVGVGVAFAIVLLSGGFE